MGILLIPALSVIQDSEKSTPLKPEGSAKLQERSFKMFANGSIGKDASSEMTLTVLGCGRISLFSIQKFTQFPHVPAKKRP